MSLLYAGYETSLGLQSGGGGRGDDKVVCVRGARVEGVMWAGLEVGGRLWEGPEVRTQHLLISIVCFCLAVLFFFQLLAQFRFGSYLQLPMILGN